MEKMKILQMLEAGRITADEAAKLLQALDNPRKTVSHSYASHSRMPESSRDAPRSNNNTGHTVPTGASGTSYSEMAGEFGRKIETFAKDMEPKLAKLTEAMVEKTANVADKISKSLSEASKTTSTYSEPPRRPEPTPPTPARPRYATVPSSAGLSERNFEISVAPGYNELSLAALNGDLLIKGYNGDKITARVSWKVRRPGAVIDLVRLGNRYYLSYDEDELEKVNIDAYIPESLFNRVNISTINGRIDITTVRCDFLDVRGTNTDSMLKGITADNINVECDNSKITLAEVRGRKGHVESFNGLIQADLLDVSEMKISTFNAPINVNLAAFDLYNDYIWKVETNNGKLSMNLPTHPAIGYDLKAQTTLNSVRIGLTGLGFIVNTPTTVEARSVDYDSAIKKIRLSMETSNAPLVVN